MLKDKEIEVFNYIKARLGDGISPSVREIMEAMGFKSTSTAHRYIETLVREGLIEKTGSLNRTLRLPNCGTTSVPIMGTPSASSGGARLSQPLRISRAMWALRLRAQTPRSFLP